MFDLTALSIFAIALALSAGSPGPSIAALVSRVVSNGWRDVLPFVAAMWIGEVIWLTCAVLGLAAIAEQFQFIFLLIKYVGIAYLLFLAWGMWRTPAGGQFDHQALPPRTSNRTKMFFAGIAVTLGNPKIMVFYMALLPTLLDLGSTTIVSCLCLEVVCQGEGLAKKYCVLGFY